MLLTNAVTIILRPWIVRCGGGVHTEWLPHEDSLFIVMRALALSNRECVS